MCAKKITLGDVARVVYAASCCFAAANDGEPKHATIEDFEADIMPGIDGINALYDAYVQLMPSEEPGSLHAIFERRAKGSSDSIRLPKLKLETPEDFYVYMVIICGVSEELFWDADFAFLWDVARAKGAFDSWLAGERERRR